MIRIHAENAVYEFSPEMSGVAEAAPGDMVVFQTQDCFAGQIRDEKTLCTEIDFGHVNPATGPLTVTGAEKGDLLGVRVEKIVVADFGIAVAVPGAGVLPGRVETPLTRIVEVDRERQICVFNGISLPLRPMIGVIGVGTAKGQVPTGTPDCHGGNMDTRDIAPGSVVWFPVFQKGAQLALGDCHAVMGDGEIGCSGAEIAAEVSVSLELLKGAAFPWPLVKTASETMIVVSAETLDRAADIASEAMVELCSRALGLDFNDALILCSLAMDLRVSQVVDPRKTVRAAMSLGVLSWEKIEEALISAGGNW